MHMVAGNKKLPGLGEELMEHGEDVKWNNAAKTFGREKLEIHFDPKALLG